MMGNILFNEKYTTNDLILKNSKESSKMILTNESYALCEMLQEVINGLARRK